MSGDKRSPCQECGRPGQEITMSAGAVSRVLVLCEDCEAAPRFTLHVGHAVLALSAVVVAGWLAYRHFAG